MLWFTSAFKAMMLMSVSSACVTKVRRKSWGETVMPLAFATSSSAYRASLV
jgi:lysophospholipid acyltransferase (LPLAT)-like uncharacterized protein